MKIKKSNKYAFSKAKCLKPESSTRIISQRLTDNSKQSNYEVSFDSFFYQDHVTLKKYSMDNLRHTSMFKRQKTEDCINEKWRQEQQTQMKKLIQFIDLWKNIKSNRNNILVYGNKKNNTQILSTQKKIAWNLEKDEQKSLYGSTQFGTERANTADNPLIVQKHFQSDQNTFQQNKSRPRSKKLASTKRLQEFTNQETSLKSQSLGKLKRKMNLQIYKLNKELLRDYLNDTKQYDSSYNHLIKEEDNLQSKLKKMITLIGVLKKQNDFKEKIVNRFSESTLKHIEDSCEERSSTQKLISNSHQPKTSQTVRLRTEINQSESPFLSKDQISLRKLKQTCKKIDGLQEPSSKKKHAPILLKKKTFTNLYRRQQQASKIQKAFEKEWENIDQEIKLKFRREAQYSLNLQSKKKKYINEQ